MGQHARTTFYMGIEVMPEVIKTALRVLLLLIVLCSAAAVSFTTATLFEYMFEDVMLLATFFAGVAYSEIVRRVK